MNHSSDFTCFTLAVVSVVVRVSKSLG